MKSKKHKTLEPEEGMGMHSEWYKIEDTESEEEFIPLNPDEEIEARWKEIKYEDWVDDPRTKGLKKGIFQLRELVDRLSGILDGFETTEWMIYEYAGEIEEKEPALKPIKNHPKNFHKGYNPKNNYRKGNFGKRNFNHRRR